MVKPRIWQVAAGDGNRRYDDLFLKYDVMFIGPGEPGPFHLATYKQAAQSNRITCNNLHRVRRFYDKVHADDIVLARVSKKVVALGIVASEESQFDERFDDIYGWSLEHCRRVIWQEHLASDLLVLQSDWSFFGSMKQIGTFTACEGGRDRIESLLSKSRERPLKPLPNLPPKPLSPDELAHALFAQGVAYDAVERVCHAIARVRRLVNWYRETGFDRNRPTEHEVVAHIILPILTSLGWSEQLMAIEWGRCDLAAFLGVPTTKERCGLVVEAKHMKHGLQGVCDQAFHYASSLVSCQTVLVTNGLQNYLYAKENDSWGSHAIGYFNLSKIRTDHLLHPGRNAVDALVELTPARVALRSDLRRVTNQESK